MSGMGRAQDTCCVSYAAISKLYNAASYGSISCNEADRAGDLFPKEPVSAW